MLVPPGLTDAELASLAGSVLFYQRRTEQAATPARLRPLILALLWRAARLVAMGERGAGAATQHDLERCAEAVYRHLRGRHPAVEDRSIQPSTEIDWMIDEQLLAFFSGPDLPLQLLVERLAPELAPDARAEVAGVLQELIRDVGEQFGLTRPVNPSD
ncbi:MAG TPA: hypothetical protein VED46_14675 [Alphaproteobacteria bacterium]|nr:hypothetical protein [Alphaproteobacteria bacterium]